MADRTKMDQSKIPSSDFDPNIPHHPRSDYANILLGNGAVQVVENQMAGASPTFLPNEPRQKEGATNPSGGKAPILRPWMNRGKA